MSVVPRPSHSRWLLLALFGLLTACAARAPLPQIEPALPQPLQLHLQVDIDGQAQDWLLVIQRAGQSLRWLLVEPLGVPLARQSLRDDGWHADGLLPPNPRARELFAALLFALTPEAQLPQAYPDQSQVSGNQRRLVQGGQLRWQVEQVDTNTFTLSIGDERYRTRLLEQGQ